MEFKEKISIITNRVNCVDIGIKEGLLDSAGVLQGGNEYLGKCTQDHTSENQKCLHIYDNLGHCFNCGYKFNIIQFVQDNLFGGRSSISFWQALDYLQKEAGTEFDFKTQKKKTDEEIIQLTILTEAAEYYHASLLSNQEAREFCKKTWGFSKEVIRKYSIGFATGEGLYKHLKSKGFQEDQIISCGLFRFSGVNPEEFFVKRIIFPYFNGIFVTYFVARETPFTPQNEYESGRKYKKMLTYSDKRKHISPFAKNSTLYNCNDIKGAKEIVLTEGVCDCISIANLGIKSISPVTKKYSKQDFETIKKQIPLSTDLIIINDNEFNLEGRKSAITMAKELSLEGYQVKVVEIPLDEIRQKKRSLSEQMEEKNG
jgi:DNA primase